MIVIMFNFAKLLQKKEEFALIEHNPSAYSAARCTSLINAGIFTIRELENKGLITQDSFRRLAGVEQFKKQNPVDPNRYKNPDEKEDDDVRQECQYGTHTIYNSLLEEIFKPGDAHILLHYPR